MKSRRVPLNPRILESAQRVSQANDAEWTPWKAREHAKRRTYNTALTLASGRRNRIERCAGAIYRETLATELSVYLLKRYAVRRRMPVVYKGGCQLVA
jgi:hypothetical protein